jgi:hypothetical protein
MKGRGRIRTYIYIYILAFPENGTVLIGKRLQYVNHVMTTKKDLYFYQSKFHTARILRLRIVSYHRTATFSHILVRLIAITLAE